jgi:sulfatase maturation enzyme AslB (radical SAM superfamily)
MIEDSVAIRCHLTTNGTQYNSRIEKIMAALPMSFAVSLDGVTKATVESIRVNASYDEQMRILKIFNAYVREKKTDLSLTFCFMRQNWHEFGEFCLFADELDCAVGVNQVLYPPQFGVYNLPAEQLRHILQGMERQAVGLESQLRRNRKVWFSEFERVRLKYLQVSRESAAKLASVG